MQAKNIVCAVALNPHNATCLLPGLRPEKFSDPRSMLEPPPILWVGHAQVLVHSAFSAAAAVEQLGLLFHLSSSQDGWFCLLSSRVSVTQSGLGLTVILPQPPECLLVLTCHVCLPAAGFLFPQVAWG